VSLSLIRRAYLTWTATRRNGLLVLDSESANFFAQTARLQATTQRIAELQSALPKLHAAVTSATAKLATAQAEFDAVQAKLNAARTERDKILGRNQTKLLEGGTQCLITAQDQK
jgi:septal ring factor EnvC (AmiA/AmiB activator)